MTSSNHKATDRWCYYCQCFHRKPYPRVEDCRAAEPEYEKRTGLIQDMLDYN